MCGPNQLTLYAYMKTLNTSQLDNPDVLGEVLTYHVISGAIFSNSISDGLTATTVNGADVTFSVSWYWNSYKWVREIEV